MAITTAQIRGARGLLNWSQQELADRTGISQTSIGSIEKGQSLPRESTLATIQKTLEDSGIEFLDGEGVRKKSGDIKVYKDVSGYLNFYEEVYTTLEKSDVREVFVSNVDERKFAKLHGNLAEAHLSRMDEIANVKYRILTLEGDDYFPAKNYGEYRWIRKSFFSSVPFYVFGKKLGIILFEPELTIIVIEYPAVTDAYRKQFMSMWETAIDPFEAVEKAG